VKSLGPLAKGLLNGMPDAAAGPAAMGPVAKYPLVLAEDRTRRPDVLHHLRMYGGGWNITNKHYWAVCVVASTLKSERIYFRKKLLWPCSSNLLEVPLCARTIDVGC
jgi:hypothetical protein